MAFGSTTFNGLSEVQAFDTLRELVRKMESGEVRVLEMSLTQEAPETKSFRTVDGRVDRQMVVSAGAMEITLRVALCDPLRAEPRDDRGRFISRDEAGRLRGDVGVPRDPRSGVTAGPPKRGVNTRDYGAMTREELMEMAGVTLADRKRVEEEILRESETVADLNTPAPADPMQYGARKLDID